MKNNEFLKKNFIQDQSLRAQRGEFSMFIENLDQRRPVGPKNAPKSSKYGQKWSKITKISKKSATTTLSPKL